MLTQGPGDTYSVTAQQLMLDIVLNAELGSVLDISKLKLMSREAGAKVTTEILYEQTKLELKNQVMLGITS